MTSSSSQNNNNHIFFVESFAFTTTSRPLSTTGSSARPSSILFPPLQAAANAEEDLELTRQIILNSMSKELGGDDVDDVDVADVSSSTTKKDDDDKTDRPENDLMIRMALGEPVDRTPVWLFRQAGRHLPEYRAYKEETQKNFLELLADPDCVAECTLQPIRRYPLDAAILFSDILVVPQALGIEVTMPGGVGIQVPNPLTSVEDFKTRIPSLEKVSPSSFVEDKLSHVLASVRKIRTQMVAENKSIPLIGFSAAPWTLLFYMVGGSSKKNTDAGVEWLKQHPDASNELLQILTRVVIDYMSAQVQNGCHMLQIFEAMGMMIDDENFEKFALPTLDQIGRELKTLYPNIPLMVFCRGACQMNDKVSALGWFDVITIDGSVERNSVRELLGPEQTIQGNYDPAEMIVENGKTIETVQDTAKSLLEELGPRHLIANLGEGLGGKENPELVNAFVNAIHDESAKMMMD